MASEPHKVDPSHFGRTLWARAKKLLMSMAAAIYSALEVGAKVAGSLSVLVGVIYGALEYNRNTQNKQVEQTFTYLRRFEEATYVTARQKIDTAFANNAKKIETPGSMKKRWNQWSTRSSARKTSRATSIMSSISTMNLSTA